MGRDLYYRMQGGVTPIATVLRSATAVKATGQRTRPILQERQWSCCFPSTVKASRDSSVRNVGEIYGIKSKSRQILTKVNGQNRKSILTAVTDHSTEAIGVTPP